MRHYDKRLQTVRGLQNKRNGIHDEWKIKYPGKHPDHAVYVEARLTEQIEKIMKIHDYLEDKIEKSHSEL